MDLLQFNLLLPVVLALVVGSKPPFFEIALPGLAARYFEHYAAVAFAESDSVMRGEEHV